MIECPFQHLLKPGLYSNASIARFLDALNQPEMESASRDALLYFVDHTPSLDDILGYLYQTEKIAQESLKKGSLRPFFTVFSPHGQITYRIRKIGMRRSHTISCPGELLSTCKALAFTTEAHCAFLVCHEEMLDRIHIIGCSIRGNKMDSTSDIVFPGIGIQFTTHRDIGNKANPPQQYQFYNVEDGHEMLSILQKVQSINSIEGIDNLPKLDEYNILLHFAVTMRAIGVFR